MCQLKFNIHSWKRINAPEYVLDWIENGVPLPLSKSVQPLELNSHKLHKYAQSTFVDSEVRPGTDGVL